MLNNKIWKRAFVPLFLVFLFLFRASYADWKFQKTKSANPRCTSYRLKFSETNSISSMNPLEFELYLVQEQFENLISIDKSNKLPSPPTEETFTSDCNCKIYLNSTSLPFPYFENTNKTKLQINYSNETVTYESLAYRLRGNQRLLIDSVTTKTLIKALLENEKVTIQVGRHKTTLSPNNFNKYYESMGCNKLSF